MTLLDTIQHLSAGPLGWASLIGALTLSARALPGIARRALSVWAAIREKREEVALERERKERAGIEHDVQVTTITAEMLARYEARLTQAEKDAREARAAVDACEERHRKAQEQHAEALAVRDRRLDAQARAIAALTEKVRMLGGTPPDMQAVDGREKK